MKLKTCFKKYISRRRDEPTWLYKNNNLASRDYFCSFTHGSWDTNTKLPKKLRELYITLRLENIFSGLLRCKEIEKEKKSENWNGSQAIVVFLPYCNQFRLGDLQGGSRHLTHTHWFRSTAQQYEPSFGTSELEPDNGLVQVREIRNGNLEKALKTNISYSRNTTVEVLVA